MECGEDDAVACAHGRAEAEEAGEAEVGGERREQREERGDEHGRADHALEAEVEGQPPACRQDGKCATLLSYMQPLPYLTFSTILKNPEMLRCRLIYW